MAGVLTVENVGVTLQGRTIIYGIHLELAEGESLAIIGPNGAGKTILLRALLGLVPHSGRIAWAPGVRFGYVPQQVQADRKLPLSFRNLLVAKAAMLHLPRKAIGPAVEAAGLDGNAADAPVGQLSGGQFQRALLAFALLGNPNVLLLDEPTASMDEPGQEHLYEMLHRLQVVSGLTVVVISHDLSMVYAYADRVMCVNRTALCTGPPREVLTPEALEQVYGGPAKFYHTDHHHDATLPDGAGAAGQERHA